MADYYVAHYLEAVYHLIKSRCTSKDNANYKHYGGRGIIVYKPWLDNKQLFFDWVDGNLGVRPTPEHTLDRINNSMGYLPGNLRWATRIEQASNRRNNRWVIYQNKKMTQSECARTIGVSRELISNMRNQKKNKYSIVFI